MATLGTLEKTLGIIVSSTRYSIKITYVSHIRLTTFTQLCSLVLLMQALRNASLEMNRIVITRSINLTLIIPNTSSSTWWSTRPLSINVMALKTIYPKKVSYYYNTTEIGNVSYNLKEHVVGGRFNASLQNCIFSFIHGFKV